MTRTRVLIADDHPLYRDGVARLGVLVKSILREVPELARLRLSSIDSVDSIR